MQEAKKFFAQVLDLNYKKVKHQKTFKKIMKQVAEMDSESNCIVMKAKVVEYFSTPGFLDLERLEQLQNEENVSQSQIFTPILISPTNDTSHNQATQSGSFTMQFNEIMN